MALGFSLYPDWHCVRESALSIRCIANLPANQPIRCTCFVVATQNDGVATSAISFSKLFESLTSSPTGIWLHQSALHATQQQLMTSDGASEPESARRSMQRKQNHLKFDFAAHYRVLVCSLTVSNSRAHTATYPLFCLSLDSGATHLIPCYPNMFLLLHTQARAQQMRWADAGVNVLYVVRLKYSGIFGVKPCCAGEAPQVPPNRGNQQLCSTAVLGTLAVCAQTHGQTSRCPAYSQRVCRKLLSFILYCLPSYVVTSSLTHHYARHISTHLQLSAVVPCCTSINAMSCASRASSRTRRCFSVFLRTAAAYRVYSLLSPQQREDLRSGKIEAREIKFSVTRKGRTLAERGSILGEVHESLRKDYPEYRKLWHGETEQGDQKLKASARKCIMFWFRRIYSFSSKDTSDKPRLTRVGANLSEEQWELLRHGLIKHTYTDRYNNSRRFPDLGAYREHLCKQALKPGCPADVGIRLANLEQAFQESRART
jgi:hypothetical protein